MRIAIFFHCLFVGGEPPDLLPKAVEIVQEQMAALEGSGLEAAASEIYVGVNGGPESECFRTWLPTKARVTYHGLQSKSENLTILMLENWVRENPDCLVLYFHTKGATADHRHRDNWRKLMMHYLVRQWRQCVADLNNGYDIVCLRWLWDQCDGTQHIPAGNFLWVKSDFVRKLPSILLRDRIKACGLGALESRYEAEVYWGNGPRPQVLQYQPSFDPFNVVVW